MFILTNKGERKVKRFLKECETKRESLLKSGKDTADDTILPTVEDIIADIGIFIDGDDYCNCWGVTDHQDSKPLALTLFEDFNEI